MHRLAFHAQRVWRSENVRTGTYVYWTPATRCSCSGEDGHARADCRLCGGFGFFWRASNERKLRAEVTQATSHRDYLALGFVSREDLAIAPEKKPVQSGANDRIRLARPDLFTYALRAEQEVLTRGKGATDAIAQRCVRLLEVVRTDDRVGSVTSYRPNVDVTFSGNVLTWLASTGSPPVGTVAPPSGVQYSVSYMADYDWVITENPTVRSIGDVEIGPRWYVRRYLRDQRNNDRVAPTGPGGFNPNLY